MPQPDRIPRPGVDPANFKFAGVTYEKVDNSAGAAVDKECRARKYGGYDFVQNGGDATLAGPDGGLYRR